MKTIKITRTINSIQITFKAVNLETESIETLTCYEVIDHELTSEEETKLARANTPSGFMFLKMVDSYMKSELYEMTAKDFMRYATYVGDGRKSFNKE